MIYPPLPPSNFLSKADYQEFVDFTEVMSKAGIGCEDTLRQRLIPRRESLDPEYNRKTGIYYFIVHELEDAIRAVLK